MESPVSGTVQLKVSIFVAAVIGLVDAILLKVGWQDVHETFLVIVIGTAATLSATQLINSFYQKKEIDDASERSKREMLTAIQLSKQELSVAEEHSKQDILAAIQLSKQELSDSGQRSKQDMLAAMKLSKLLAESNKVAGYIKEVIHDYDAVHEKKSCPEFTDEVLARELDLFRGKLHGLGAGEIECDLNFGQTLAPKFFSLWKGDCFVTCYSPWGWWRETPGTAQLQANKKRIDEGRGPITRYFVLFRNTALPDDDIIARHIDAGVDIRVTNGDEIEKRLRLDVGVFFNGDQIVFLSIWNNGTEQNSRTAQLLFGGQRFWLAQGVYNEFTQKAASVPIPTIETWKEYKVNYLTERQ